MVWYEVLEVDSLLVGNIEASFLSGHRAGVGRDVQTTGYQEILNV